MDDKAGFDAAMLAFDEFWLRDRHSFRGNPPLTVARDTFRAHLTRFMVRDAGLNPELTTSSTSE